MSAPFAAHVSRHRLVSMETARQGMAVEVNYELELRPEGSAEGLLKSFNRLDGVQNVHLEDTGVEDD